MAKLCLLAIGVLACYCIARSDAIAVMSVDLGTEWIKIAIVSPGVPMEIVLNKESKRKTPVAMSFRNGDREFGESAVGMTTRFPEKVYRFILDLLGKQLDNPMVEIYKKRFPFHEIIADETRNTIVFKHNEGPTFTPEELIAMILANARDLAQTFSRQPVKEVVITVPAFFKQAERRSVMAAAELAGLKLLQLMSDNAAVALNYGIFRRKDFNATMQRIMFYDMGAGSTTVTIVGYQEVKTKEKGFVENNPQLSILGVGYDRTLGGLEMTLRLREYLAKKFNEQRLTTTDIFTSERALSRLLKEAERVKMVLSANNDHVAQVEGILDDKDFRQAVSRAEFEGLCEELFERVSKPIEGALRSAAMTADDINQVILVGAGTRVPKVQDEILKATKKSELGKNLNTDEAAALGAVYQAAHLGQGFKVKRFVVKEAVLFPVQVSFDRHSDEDGSSRTITRTLFAPLNPFPQKKVMTFNRHFKDFDLHVSYVEPNLSKEERAFFGTLDIAKVSLKGVAEALEKHNHPDSEHKGIKAHFKMDDSGILILDQVECVFDKTVLDAIPEVEESTLSKLGSTISKLFSSVGQDELKEEKLESNDGDQLEEQLVEPEENVTGKLNESTNDTITDKTETNKTSTPKNDSSESEKNETKSETITKIQVVKEKLVVLQIKLDLQDPSSDSMINSRKKLQEYDDKAREKEAREEAHNALESFVIETKDKLYQTEYEDVTTEDEREKIFGKLNDASEWLDEESHSATVIALKDKLSELKTATKAMFERIRERRERPDAVTALREMLNVSSFFLSQARNASESEQYFTDVELESLEKLIVSTQEWLVIKEDAQANTEPFKEPILTVRGVTEKIAAIDREVKYLINKARINSSKPKVKKSEKNDSAESANQTEGVLPEEAIAEDEEDEKPDSIQTNEETEPISPSEPSSPESETPHTEL